MHRLSVNFNILTYSYCYLKAFVFPSPFKCPPQKVYSNTALRTLQK